jgi:hypothetical protein
MCALGCELGNEAGVRRNEMLNAMTNALALMRWHDSGFLENFNGHDFAWMLIGASLALVVFWVVTRQRRRWF